MSAKTWAARPARDPGGTERDRGDGVCPAECRDPEAKPGRPECAGALGRYRRFGNPDNVFAQSRPKSGLITQGEVRAIGLAQMAILPGSVVWDIGAGLRFGGHRGGPAQRARHGLRHRARCGRLPPDPGQCRDVSGSATSRRSREWPCGIPRPAAPDAIFIGGNGKEAAGC